MVLPLSPNIHIELDKKLLLQFLLDENLRNIVSLRLFKWAELFNYNLIFDKLTKHQASVQLIGFFYLSPPCLVLPILCSLTNQARKLQSSKVLKLEVLSFP